MKKTFLQTLLLFLVMLFTSITASAYDFEADGIYYNITSSKNKTVKVSYKNTNYNSYSSEVVIPSEVTYNGEKYTVISIGESAFEGCSGLTEVTIPNSVTSIGEQAFQNCCGLTEVNISSIESWCKIDFAGYSSNPLCYANKLKLNGEEIKDLIIPNTVTEIKPYAFYRCYSLVGQLILPETITSIGKYAFSMTKYSACKIEAKTPPTITTSSLPSDMFIVFVPNGSAEAYKADANWGKYKIIVDGTGDVEVTNETAGQLARAILVQARKNLDNITKLTVHGTLNADDMEQINSNMTSLLYLDLTDTDVTELPAEIFKDKKTLLGVKFPKNLKTIGYNAFYGCSNLIDELELPETLETIGSYAFNGCNLLGGNLKIPAKVESIGTNAFANCERIDSVDMSAAENLKTLNGDVFNYCYSLKWVDFPKNLTSLGYYAFSGCSSLAELNLPASIETIGSYAFYGCSSLTSLDLSECTKLKEIQSSVFKGCSKLQTVNRPSSLTSIGSEAFAGCTGLLQMSVPCAVPPTIANNSEPFKGVDNIACVLSIPSDNMFEYYSANYWGALVDVENKSEITVDVTNPEEDDDNSTEEIPENGENQGGNHHHHHHGCFIHYGKHHPHGGGYKPHAMSMKSLKATATTSEQENEDVDKSTLGVTANGQSLFVGNGDAVTFYLTPDAGKQIESVLYNGKDVTKELVNNTYTTAAVGADAISTFEVKLKNSTLVGDVNGDNIVNATDIVALANYINGKATESFNEKNADVNNDGTVNVTDIVALANVIMTK